MHKKRIVINLIGWLYIGVLTIVYYSERYPFITTGFSGFIIFMVGVCMCLYSPKVDEDFKKWFGKNNGSGKSS